MMTATTVEQSVSTSLGGSLCLFYSTDCPLSDSAPIPFVIDGKLYATIEHYMQLQMCYSFGLFKVASKTIEIKDAHQFRRALRTELKSLLKSGLFDKNVFSKWKDMNAMDMMQRGNQAKFDQNSHIRQLLISTGDRLLCFATDNDKRLGIGMNASTFLYWLNKNNVQLDDLFDWFVDVRLRPHELGRNVLGLSLMDIRASYQFRASLIAEWRSIRLHNCAFIQHSKGEQTTIAISADEQRLLKLSGIVLDETIDEKSINTTISDQVISSSFLTNAQLFTSYLLSQTDASDKVIVEETLQTTNVDNASCSSTSIAPAIKKSRWQSSHTEHQSAEQLERRWHDLLLRLESLIKLRQPMLNPHTIAAEQKLSSAPAVHKSQPPTPSPCKPIWPPRGTPYFVEKGEIPPTGVIPPPPGVDGPAYLLPLGIRDWIIRPSIRAQGMPAGIPTHLLPTPSCPPDVHPIVWQQRFASPIPRFDYHGRLKSPATIYPSPRPPLIEAPLVEPKSADTGMNWNVVRNSLAKTLYRARNFKQIVSQKVNEDLDREEKRLQAIREMLDKRRMRYADEATDPSTKTSRNFDDDNDCRLYADEEAAIDEMRQLAEKDPIAFCRQVFPFGMEVGIDDLIALGFVPPPIVGNRQAQGRNKKLVINSWLSQFDNAYDALRYFARRWICKGRLTTTGEYEDTDNNYKCDSNQRDIVANFDEDDDDRYKRQIETQIVYVDTSHYNHYVKFYQKVHGFVPIPNNNELEMRMDMMREWYHYYQQCNLTDAEDESAEREQLESRFAMGPEQLYAGHHGDFWALSRWKWARWEQRLARGDDAKFLDIKQETRQDDITISAQPLVYHRDTPTTSDELTDTVIESSTVTNQEEHNCSITIDM